VKTGEYSLQMLLM